MVTLQAVAVPSSVVRVVDGDTIIVRLNDADERVRLLWIDTPESRGNSHGAARPEGKQAGAALGVLLKDRDSILLWGPGATLKRDRYQRILAVVAFDLDAVTGQPRTSAQHGLIQGGWSPVWRKYGDPPEPLLGSWLALEREAEGAARGAWGTATDYMINKRNERTAKKNAARHE